MVRQLSATRRLILRNGDVLVKTENIDQNHAFLALSPPRGVARHELGGGRSAGDALLVRSTGSCSISDQSYPSL